MVFAEAVRLIRAHVESKFPKTCTMCGRLFSNLADYLRDTRYVGQPVSYDAEMEEWTPKEPVGSYAMSRCPCGTSLTIDSSGVPLVTLWRLMRFARGESHRRDVTVSEVLVEIRGAVRNEVLADDDCTGETGVAAKVAVWSEDTG
jgi:hypothetical protein